MEVVKTTLKLGAAGLVKSVAVLSSGQSHSYAQVLQSALQVASILQSQPQKSRNGAVNSDTTSTSESGKSSDGPRIGIIAKPCAEFVAGMLGAWLNGAIAVPLALSYPEAELLHVFTDADVSIVFGTEEYQEVLEAVAEKVSARFFLLPLVSSIKESERGSLDITQALSQVGKIVSSVSDAEGALIIYTSGTTGKPKGVVHSHGSIGSQANSASAELRKRLLEGPNGSSAWQSARCGELEGQS